MQAQSVSYVVFLRGIYFCGWVYDGLLNPQLMWIASLAEMGVTGYKKDSR